MKTSKQLNKLYKERKREYEDKKAQRFFILSILSFISLSAIEITEVIV